MTTQDEPRPDAAAISPWSWAAVAVSLALVLWANLARFRDPVGEKVIFFMEPGAADFTLPFLASYAMLSGEDPYLTRDPRFLDPWGRNYDLGNGRASAQVYLPTHYLLLAPLVTATAGNSREAGRIWFRINLLVFAGLAVVTWRLMLWAGGLERWPRSLTAALMAIPATVLPLSVAGGFVFERGQSDALTALLCWAAVAAAVRDRPSLSMFLAIGSVLLKGYGALFAIGLFLVFDGSRRRRAAVGATVALVILLLPVARYLPTAVALVRARADFPDYSWYNHSFHNLAHNLVPGWESAGQRLLTAIALLAGLGCWIQARRAFRTDALRADRASWLTLFTLTSLAATVGYLPSSYPYNLILILPGTLILAFGQEALARAARIGRRGQWALGVAIILSLACFHLYKVGTRTMAKRFAPAGVGLAGVTLIAGAYATIGLRRTAPPAPVG